jgi:hypothetical protein
MHIWTSLPTCFEWWRMGEDNGETARSADANKQPGLFSIVNEKHA